MSKTQFETLYGVQHSEKGRFDKNREKGYDFVAE